MGLTNIQHFCSEALWRYFFIAWKKEAGLKKNTGTNLSHVTVNVTING